MTKSDAGTWVLAGTNTYSGNTTLNTAGRLNLANSSALGTGTLVIGGNGSFDNITPPEMTVPNGLTCSGGSPTYAGTVASLIINGPVLITGANRTITVTSNMLTFGSTVGDSGQNRNLTKAGNGMLKFLGTASYGGNTTISAGTLRLDSLALLGNGSYAGNIANSGIIECGSSSAQTFSGVLSGAGIFRFGSQITLSATNTYTGTTEIESGTLALSGNGSINNSSNISLSVGGVTFDVSGLSSTTYTLSSNTTFTIVGGMPIPSPSSLIGANGGLIDFGSRPITIYYYPVSYNGDTSHPQVNVFQATLSLGGNLFTIDNFSSTPMGVGTYTLIRQTFGSIAHSGIFPTTMTGAGVVAGNSGYISVNGGSVNLVVAPTVSFSNLTPNQSINSGAASITLAGIVSGAGPIYPAMGETVTAIINGNSQSTTINDATGDFSFSYNPSAIPASGTPYTITYNYAGNGTVMSSALNTSTTLTVNNPLSHTNVITSVVNNGNGTFTLNLVGTPQASYYIQRTTSLSVPVNWLPVLGSTNSAGASGAWSFVVSNPAPAFYRSVAVNPAP